MIKKGADFVSRQRTGKPLHVVFYEDLHGGAVDRTRPLDRHAHTAADRHVRAQENSTSRRTHERANRRSLRFVVFPFRRFVFAHYRPFRTAGRQSGFLRLPVPAYSKSLYTGVSNMPGPFMFKRILKSSLSSR